MAGGIYELRNFFTFVVALIALQKFGNAAKAKNKYKAFQTRMFGAVRNRFTARKLFIIAHCRRIGQDRLSDGLLLRTPH